MKEYNRELDRWERKVSGKSDEPIREDPTKEKAPGSSFGNLKQKRKEGTYSSGRNRETGTGIWNDKWISSDIQKPTALIC